MIYIYIYYFFYKVLIFTGNNYCKQRLWTKRIETLHKFLFFLLLCSSKNYLYAIQLKGTQGAKVWPVLRLVKLELKGSVQLKSKVKICICIYIIN